MRKSKAHSILQPSLKTKEPDQPLSLQKTRNEDRMGVAAPSQEEKPRTYLFPLEEEATLCSSRKRTSLLAW
jgi:hypothetical protein